jgi:DNA-directed RNA polymerase subunit RPC12/RpoP
MGVKLIPAACPKCGANVEIPESLKKAHCVYCGAEILIDSPATVLSVAASNALKVAKEFLKDGALEKARETIDRAYENDPFNEDIQSTRRQIYKKVGDAEWKLKLAAFLTDYDGKGIIYSKTTSELRLAQAKKRIQPYTIAGTCSLCGGHGHCLCYYSEKTGSGKCILCGPAFNIGSCPICHGTKKCTLCNGTTMCQCVLEKSKCPKCKSQCRWIPQYKNWYCDRCSAYIDETDED